MFPEHILTTKQNYAELFPDKFSFSKFGSIHFAILGIIGIVMAANVDFYKKQNKRGRRKTLWFISMALLVTEILRMSAALFTGQWCWDFLPLDLCGINIFVCIWHAYTRNRVAAELLYSLCLPGALVALLMPNWNRVPLYNLFGVHSWFCHILLVLYPVLMLAGGYKPNIKYLPKVVLVTLAEAVPIYFVNKSLNTNFFFLNGTDNNPVLELGEKLFGGDLYFLILLLLVPVVWGLMYAPWIIIRKKKRALLKLEMK